MKPSLFPKLKTASLRERIPPFWRFQLAGWITYLVLSFPLKVLFLGSVQAAVIVAIVRDGFAFLVTLGMRAVYRRLYRPRMRMGWTAFVVISVCLTAGLLLTLFSWALEHVIALEDVALFGELNAFRLFYFCTSLSVGWSLLYFGIKFMRDAAERELRLALIESEKRNAQLQILRTQMDPHLLFNALNAIQTEIGKHDPILKETVKALAQYLRFSLNHRDDELIPMGLEYDTMMAYLKVEKLRFREDLAFECHIDETARKAAVPGIILQPLVENAIKYGQQTSDLPLHVQVTITKPLPNELQITVTNTGRWLEPAEIPIEKRSHIGLENIRRRLSLIYPDRQHSLTSKHGNGWVTVEIRIPVVN